MLKRTLSGVLFLGMVASPLAAQEMADEGVTAEIVIATGVEDREPVGEATEFPADVGTVYAWTRISGAANTTIQHVWRFGDHEFPVSLNIGNGSPWRTWSTKSIPAEWDGEWTLEVRDADGNVVASTTFTVGGGM